MPNKPITCLSVHHRVGENSHTLAYAYAMCQSVTGPLVLVYNAFLLLNALNVVLQVLPESDYYKNECVSIHNQG